jgi:hypothetical protein
MRSDDLVLVQGLRDTRATLSRWNRRPWPITRGWLAGSVAVTLALLAGVYVVAILSLPDPAPLALPGVTRPVVAGDMLRVVSGNLLVLALHALACVAGFIARSSLPLAATRQSGVWRRVHEQAGPLAIAFVTGATLFSLASQVVILGGVTASLAAQLGVRPGVLLVGLLPHAVPELVALFLPLAAWLIASRRREWHELLAATFVTVAIAVPVLVLSAAVETYVSPRLVLALASRAP